MNPVQHTRSLWLGALCATLAPPVSLVFMALSARPSVPSASNLLTGIGGVFFIATPVSFLAMMLLGLPLVLLLRRLGLLSWVSVCLAATVVGAVAFAAFAWALTWDHRAPGTSQYFIGAVLGLVSGAAFCLGAGPVSGFRRVRPGVPAESGQPVPDDHA